MTEAADVVVIGGANADIKSRADAALIHGTSNAGTTTVSAGGVGRNIAETLARLGVRVSLVSAMGDDAFGRFVLSHAAEAGIDTSAVRAVPGATTGVYNAILDADGGLLAGVASMHVLDTLTAEVVRAHEAMVRAARWLVLDANLAPDTLAAALDLAARHDVPVAIEPVSVAKAARLAAVLRPERPVAILTPNRAEFVALVGRPIDDTALSHAAERLHARGVRTVWVRLGPAGSLLHHADGRVEHVPTIEIHDVADVTGAGDAALASYIWAAMRGKDASSAARYGTAAALCTLRSNGSADALVSPNLLETIEQTLPENR